ncbi:MAG TPA: DUF1489 domain-containing protein [Stellaceae bacterium]|nr:DUF1489 domain-containing protein [Stellaceae bacterium]
MPLHLVKMAVGIEDIGQLRRIRAARRQERGGSWVYTRNRPLRAEQVLAGGSIYWVIRGQIRVRQRVVGFRSERDENGRRYCLIEVDDTLVPTLLRAFRPFQGWRYLSPADAPGDLERGEAPPPDRMLAELRELGLS